jgi:superfamily II helicase
MRIWQLIIQISKIFKMRCSEFRIVTNNGPLSESIYNDPISTYIITSVKIKRIEEKVLDKENPRRLIAQNKPFLQKMLNSMAIRHTTKS